MGQSTIEVVGKLQSQLDAIQKQLEVSSQTLRVGGSSGGPWALTTAYRIPKTPLTLLGRYQGGRADVELSLSPDKDPANSQAGFVAGLGPANLGISFNDGL